MKNSIIILILLILFSCSNTTDNKEIRTIDNLTANDTIQLKAFPTIGDLLADSVIQTSNNRMQLASSSQFSPSTTITHQGLFFDLAWDKEGRLTYLSTTDSSFMTEEKVKLNMTLNEIIKIQDVEILSMPGWGYYIKLESGWFAAFCVDSTCTGRELTVNDKVKWIYKN